MVEWAVLVLSVFILVCLESVSGSSFEIIPTWVVAGDNVEITCSVGISQAPIHVQIYKTYNSSRNDAVFEVINGTRTYSSELVSRAIHVRYGINFVNIVFKAQCSDDGIYGCHVESTGNRADSLGSLSVTPKLVTQITVGAGDKFVPGNHVLFKCRGSVRHLSDDSPVVWTRKRNGISEILTKDILSKFQDHRGEDCSYGYSSFMWYELEEADENVVIICGVPEVSSGGYTISLTEDIPTTTPLTTQTTTMIQQPIMRHNSGLVILIVGIFILVVGVILNVVAIPQVRSFILKLVRKQKSQTEDHPRPRYRSTSENPYEDPVEIEPTAPVMTPTPPGYDCLKRNTSDADDYSQIYSEVK